jgi:hypothetical protein
VAGKIETVEQLRNAPTQLLAKLVECLPSKLARLLCNEVTFKHYVAALAQKDFKVEKCDLSGIDISAPSTATGIPVLCANLIPTGLLVALDKHNNVLKVYRVPVNG